MMTFDFALDHFALFNLPRHFDVDLSALNQGWRDLQSEYHPDRAASLSDSDRRVALQAATRVNEAYQTLKSPLARGRYLLSLHGIDTQEETNTAMPLTFLMQQMEWREAVADARATGDVDALEILAEKIRQETRLMENELGQQLEQNDCFHDAAMTVRKLRFMEKLDQEISDAIGILLA